MRHEAVHIPDFGIETFQLLNEFFYVRLFKIQLAGIVLRNDLASEKLLPVFLFLQDKPIRKNHVSFIIKNQLKTEQIMIESSGSFNIFYNYQYILDVSKQYEIMPDTMELMQGLQQEFDWYKNNLDSVYYRKPYIEYIEKNIKNKS